MLGGSITCSMRGSSLGKARERRCRCSRLVRIELLRARPKPRPAQLVHQVLKPRFDFFEKGVLGGEIGVLCFETGVLYFETGVLYFEIGLLGIAMQPRLAFNVELEGRLGERPGLRLECRSQISRQTIETRRINSVDHARSVIDPSWCDHANPLDDSICRSGYLHQRHRDAPPVKALKHDSECIGGCVADSKDWKGRDKRSLTFRYRYPEQETKLREGSAVHIAAGGEPAGAIFALDEASRVVTLKRSSAKGELPKELSLLPGGPVNTDPLRDAVWMVARDMAALREVILTHGRDLGCRLRWVPVAAILAPEHTRPSGGRPPWKYFSR